MTKSVPDRMKKGDPRTGQPAANGTDVGLGPAGNDSPLLEDTMANRWFAVFAKPRSEHRVAMALKAKGIVAFVPSLVYHGKRGNMLVKPFFPRYLFAQFDWSQGRTEVLWTPGVTRLVTFDDRPAWLSSGEVELLRRRLSEIDGDDWLRLKPGERVRVTAGPFRGLEAVFDRHLNSDARVAILLHILGRHTSVSLPAGDVRRIGG